MRLKPSLKKPANHALKLIFIAFTLLSCSRPPAVTPSIYLKENIAFTIQDICKKDYNFNVKARLVGSTLWCYLTTEDMIVNAKKPEKFTERFTIEYNSAKLKDNVLNVNYRIKEIPAIEKIQQYGYNKKLTENINNVMQVIRRVIFNMKRDEEAQIKFLCLVIADIKNGFETKEISYYPDLKKLSYGFLSQSEYQHRAISQTDISSSIIGDRSGWHLAYNDINLKDFICLQIKHRIALNFQKDLINNKSVNVDREITRIAAETIKIYGFKDFNELKLNNLLTNYRIILNRQAVEMK